MFRPVTSCAKVRIKDCGNACWNIKHAFDKIEHSVSSDRLWGLFVFLNISQLITSLQAVKKSEPRYCSVIWGPTCDSIDKITESYWIPELYVGDWLLVDNMGAYTVSVTTDFNSFEKAHIYTVVTAETWHSLNLSRAYDTVH